MLFTPFTFYIAYLVGNQFPVMRMYTGTLLSMLGLCSVFGYYFPTSAIVQALYMIQLVLVVDTFTTNHEILWKVAGFYLCQALMQPPDVYYAASLGIYALAPTYYMVGTIVPSVYYPFVQGVLYVAQVISSLSYICSTQLPIYTAVLHIVFLTISVYEFGRWTSRLRAV